MTRRRAVRALLSLVLVSASASGSTGILRPEGVQDSLDRSLRAQAIAGSVSRIEALIRQGADIDSKAPHGECALEYAIRYGRFAAALKLIEKGANPNSADDSGLTPLLRAAGEPNASRVVEALLKAGADVNHSDQYGRTALMNAAHSDNVRAVAILLLRAKDRIQIDARNDSLQTAADLAQDGLIPRMLELAARYRENGSDEVVKLAEKVK